MVAQDMITLSVFSLSFLHCHTLSPEILYFVDATVIFLFGRLDKSYEFHKNYGICIPSVSLASI
jgi:hypothetical protein